MKINIKKIKEAAIIPTYGTEYSAGADLYALLENDVEIKPQTNKLINTGISLAIPEGYVGLIFARSGLSTKLGLAPANKVGVIDADYRGEILVSLYNQSQETRTVKSGERIAQLVIIPFIQASFDECEQLDETTRGNGGFGSTGSK